LANELLWCRDLIRLLAVNCFRVAEVMVTQQLNVGLNINAILPRAYMSDIRLLYSFYK
jgi:hypothetical protein